MNWVAKFFLVQQTKMGKNTYTKMTKHKNTKTWPLNRPKFSISNVPKFAFWYDEVLRFFA
jgi:hypothetical protein